ncbi:unnamed protein product [Penicillium discolor]
MTGTGLNVQGILFALLILGHAFPVFAFISLLRAISFRTALNDAPTEEKGDQAVPQMPILQLEEQIGCCKEDSFPAKLTDKAKVRMAGYGMAMNFVLPQTHNIPTKSNEVLSLA